MVEGRTAAPGVAADNVLAGVLWMVLTSALFVVMDVIAKELTQSYPINQVTWARFTFHALFIALFLRSRLPETLRSNRIGLQLLRSLFMFGTNLLFFSGLFFLDLIEATAIMYVTPLLVTLLSMPVLGEAVGWRRVISVAVGFLGAMVIIRPGSDAFAWAMLFPLGAALSHAGYQLTTRLVTKRDSALTSLCYTALVGTLLSSLALPFFGWQWPDALGWLGMAAIGLVGCLSHFTFIKAFTAANAAVIAPFGYLSLLWAAAFGFLIFAELPDYWTLVGAAIVASSGLYILHRERVRKVRPTAAWRPSR